MSIKMALPRSSLLRNGLRSSFRPNATRAQPQSFRQVLRRGYATEGDHHKKGSDLPWAVGSVIFTVPAAGWLLSNGPKAEAHPIPTQPGTKQDVPSPEKKGRMQDLEKTQEEREAKEEAEEQPKEESDEEQPEEESDKPKDEKVSSAGGQPSDQADEGKRESNDPDSGAQNPFLDSDEKSHKGEGVKETAKIHGTVDSDRPIGGQGGEKKE